MKEALITTALVMFTAVMFLLPVLWEPESEAEAFERIDERF